MTITQQKHKGTHTFTLGVTGGIGSGKTAVTDWFNQQGIDVIDADVVARTITAKGSPVLDKLCCAFGDWVLTDTGEYNRTAMREYVFSHADAIVKLNAITHPAIRQKIIEQLNNTTSAYRILAVPLLIESMHKPDSLAKLCQRILVVKASEHNQIKRASKRDGQTIDNIKSIISRQATPQERLRAADDIVNNDGTLNHLYDQLSVLHHKYLQIADSFKQA
ncbi:dephospho-CoA kinase [Moraxella nasovis]|uniref:dephospho-CoA kinase n=1 Tax=Moraxella nasovis TaxID=2904121 RepID=UPI001F60192D|nr:dephospho-CoA kinase [Moraxella nasovis]UNU72585.1 dephospho-CoA kinase [Moraxella nasovis]